MQVYIFLKSGIDASQSGLRRISCWTINSINGAYSGGQYPHSKRNATRTFLGVFEDEIMLKSYVQGRFHCAHISQHLIRQRCSHGSAVENSYKVGLQIFAVGVGLKPTWTCRNGVLISVSMDDPSPCCLEVCCVVSYLRVHTSSHLRSLPAHTSVPKSALGVHRREWS